MFFKLLFNIKKTLLYRCYCLFLPLFCLIQSSSETAAERSRCPTPFTPNLVGKGPRLSVSFATNFYLSLRQDGAPALQNLILFQKNKPAKNTGLFFSYILFFVFSLFFIASTKTSIPTGNTHDSASPVFNPISVISLPKIKFGKKFILCL